MMYMCICAFKRSFSHEPVLNSTQTQLIYTHALVFPRVQNKLFEFEFESAGPPPGLSVRVLERFHQFRNESEVESESKGGFLSAEVEVPLVGDEDDEFRVDIRLVL